MARLTAYRVDDEERFSPRFLAEWTRLLSQSNSLYCQYSSPEWVESAIRSGYSSYSIFAVRESADSLSGLLVWREREITLRTGPKRLCLWIDRPALSVEGDLLLKRPLNQDVLSALIDVFPRDKIVQIKSITADHPAWNVLNKAEFSGLRHFLWMSNPSQPLLYRAMPTCAGNVEIGLSERRLRHLRQGARALSRLEASQVTLERTTSAGQIVSFRAAATDIIERSWQRRVPLPHAYTALQNEAFLRMLADRGILRAYILRAGGRACAFVLGYQYRGVFHYSDVAYDEALAHASPGILLLHYLMQDLASWNPPRLVNFGIGDALYKRLFSNSHAESNSILFLPKTPANLFLLLLGRLFDAMRHARPEKTIGRVTRSPRAPMNSGEACAQNMEIQERRGESKTTAVRE